MQANNFVKNSSSQQTQTKVLPEKEAGRNDFTENKGDELLWN